MGFDTAAVNNVSDDTMSEYGNETDSSGTYIVGIMIVAAASATRIATLVGHVDAVERKD